MLEAVATFCDQLVPSLTWGVKQQYDAQRTCYITPSFHINLRGGGHNSTKRDLWDHGALVGSRAGMSLKKKEN